MPARSIPAIPVLRGGILGPTPVDCVGFGLCDPLSLSATATLIVLARHSGKHIQHHCIYGREHARRELISGRRQLPACRQVERNYSDLLGVKFRPELAPVGVL